MGNDHSTDQPTTSSSSSVGNKTAKNKSHSNSRGSHHGEFSEDTTASEADHNLSVSSAVSTKPSINRQPSTARSAETEDSLYQALGLSNYQIQMLSQSWPRVQQTGGHAVGGSLFRKLSSKNPQCRQSFQKMSIIEGFSPRGGRSVDVYKEHGRLLFDLLNDAIKSLNEPAITVITTCRDYGAKHSALSAEGFTNIIWDELSEILVEHITKNDAVRKHRELSKAWTALITFLIEKIKDGYKSNLRKPSSHPASALGLQQTKYESPSPSTNEAKRQLSSEDDQQEGERNEQVAKSTDAADGKSEPLTP